MSVREKYFTTDKHFYEATARITVPMALQNILISCMSMVDTLMVSWIGMVSAVGTAAQVDVLHSMIVFGCTGGVGIFASQFNGAGDKHNLKRCMGLGLTLSFANSIFWFFLATVAGEQILRFYMDDPAVVANGLLYLSIFKYSLFLTSYNFAFSNMYRSIGKPRIALICSIVGSVTNVLFNWLLIFGVGPFPEMGVRGAALGTVIGQLVAAALLTVVAIRTQQPFIGPLREMFGLDMDFVQPIFARIAPLIINEGLFGVGQTLFVKAFGLLGTAQMDAYYIGNQIYNFVTFLIYGYGGAVQIMLGTRLGSGDIEGAKRECNYHIGLATILAAFLVTVLIILAKPLVALFGQDEATSSLAVTIVFVFAVKAALRMYNFLIFCILRAGGDAKIIQFLDSGLEWLVGLPCAFLSVTVFHLKGIALVLLIAQIEQLVRMILGMKRVRTYKWAEDLTKLVN
ncbi:MAG: MATE family efflux transporter [Mogibacterium sp.]|nr:MATE family efflux transporter [Mogibacterium sp.]